MGLTTCRECNREVSDAAETCPHCGVRNPSRTGYWGTTIAKILGGAAGVFAVLVVVGYIMGGAGSTCKVISVQNSEDAFIVNGELDYGIVTRAVVALDGRGREVTIEARLETNEGDFTKVQRINVSENGQREVQVQFPEPTIAANIVRSVVTCR
ncbi:hypothetical protein K1T73_10945 [Roseovarius sp. SCSIO 43702]|uniref:hypothetical protein n=1 Tax=Roseovarius sp. SCSIO 43702 TaxID=2823043 RepID=UPI001C72D81B|nr:hypothetical protein [Roseovarius sp. SCSIO 43702]QYX55607.1 hypothetical protein K1T73_10945 [Roseovarius sp. SCSIO 43702]